MVDDVCYAKHREGRLKQEMENLRQQNEWLNQELQEKVHELMTSRKDKVSHSIPDFCSIIGTKVLLMTLKSYKCSERSPSLNHIGRYLSRTQRAIVLVFVDLVFWSYCWLDLGFR